MDKLLTLNEAAARLNVHPETLRRWDRDEKLVAIKVNRRGDRRYRESDILQFMNKNSDLITHKSIITYAGYSISWYTKGFVVMPANFHLIAQMIATSDKNTIYFAFFEDMSTAFARVNEKDNLESDAINEIKKIIDKNLLSDGDLYTYQFLDGRFKKVINPEWWHGKYSKSLVPGLRVEAHITHPTTSEHKAWRVILYFKSKQDDQWLTSTFGKDNRLTEYFVWIDSKELGRNGLSNTAKSAEILAIDFGVKRFNETKNEDGIRDITRINENNAACFGGKCIKDSLLPDEQKIALTPY
jgi:excisionase family DNA binding protein